MVHRLSQTLRSKIEPIEHAFLKKNSFSIKNYKFYIYFIIIKMMKVWVSLLNSREIFLKFPIVLYKFVKLISQISDLFKYYLLSRKNVIDSYFKKYQVA